MGRRIRSRAAVQAAARLDAVTSDRLLGTRRRLSLVMCDDSHRRRLRLKLAPKTAPKTAEEEEGDEKEFELELDGNVRDSFRRTMWSPTDEDDEQLAFTWKGRRVGCDEVKNYALQFEAGVFSLTACSPRQGAPLPRMPLFGCSVDGNGECHR